MFKCENCPSIASRMFKVVTKVRDQEYRNVIQRYREGEKTEETKLTRGWEIVQEMDVCERCSGELIDARPQKKTYE